MPKALGGFLGGGPGVVPFSKLFPYYRLVPVPDWGPPGVPQEVPRGDSRGDSPRGDLQRFPQVLDRFWIDSESILNRFKLILARFWFDVGSNLGRFWRLHLLFRKP